MPHNHPPRGRHRSRPSQAPKNSRRTLIRLAIAGPVLATLVGLAAQPAALVAIGVLLAPVAIATAACYITSSVLTAAGR